MDLNLDFEWIEHDVSSRHAKKRTYYWVLRVGALDRDVANVESKPKSFEAYCWLPGVDNTKKRYFKDPDAAKRRAEELVRNWFDTVLKGATLTLGANVISNKVQTKP